MTIAPARLQATATTRGVRDGFEEQATFISEVVLVHRPTIADMLRGGSKGKLAGYDERASYSANQLATSIHAASATPSASTSTSPTKVVTEIAPILDEYVEVSESTPSEPSPYTNKHYALLELKCSYPISSIGKAMGVTYDPTRYFAACEPKNSSEKTVLAPDSKVKGRVWAEVSLQYLFLTICF